MRESEWLNTETSLLTAWKCEQIKLYNGKTENFHRKLEQYQRSPKREAEQTNTQIMKQKASIVQHINVSIYTITEYRH